MFNPQAYYTYRTASCQFDCNANEYWWWSTAAMTGILKNRLRWDGMTSSIFQHFSNLAGIHQVWGEEWVQVLPSRGVQSQGPQDVRSDHGEYISSIHQVSGCPDFWPFWILNEKSVDQMIGKILTNNFYHRTRRSGTNCPPDHRMENTLARGPASQGQMWSDCFF